MHVATRIKVDGSTLPYNVRKVRWAQNLYEYDRFAITLADPDLVQGSGKVADITRDIAVMLGKSLVIDLECQDGQYPGYLQGIITQVRGRYVHRGVEVTLEGCGAAHVLDRVVHTRIFLDQTLDQIVQAVVTPAASVLTGRRIQLGSWASVKVPFCCQYQETDFAFLRRLCATWGWVLCAPGNELVILDSTSFSGIPGYSTQTTLCPGNNCLAVDAAIQAMPVTFLASSFQHYGDRGLRDGNYGNEQTKLWTSNVQASGQGLAGSGLAAGQSMYSSSAAIHQGGVHWGQSEADTQSSRWSRHAAGEAVSFGGRSWALGIQLGQQAKIDTNEDLAVDWVEQESVLITAVEHALEADDYSNQFRGCGLNTPKLLDPAQYPQRDRYVTLPATVTKSDDPSRVGRVKVMPLPLGPTWLPETIHVRVAARAAGPDHGELILPEVGDEILLGFHPDAFEEPIVTAVLYNGTNKTLPDKLPAHARLNQAQIDKNDLKWTLTRGGNALILDDTAGSERLLAVTKTGSLELSEVSSGPHMLLTVRDGQNPKCTLTFDKQGQVTLRAKNVLFDIDETIDFKAGKDFLLNAQGKISLKAGTDAKIEAGTQLVAKAGTDAKIEAGTKMEVKAGTDLTVKAGMNAKIEAAMNASVKGGMQLKLEGGMQSELKGGAMVTVQGGLVKIN
jgi:type VI secretion system secreted protein VgrG